MFGTGIKTDHLSLFRWAAFFDRVAAHFESITPLNPDQGKES